MYRCKNAQCAKLIKRDRDHVRADVLGHEEHWCDEKCLEEWRTHGGIFIRTGPAERRVRLHSEHRRRA